MGEDTSPMARFRIAPSAPAPTPSQPPSCMRFVRPLILVVDIAALPEPGARQGLIQIVAAFTDPG